MCGFFPTVKAASAVNHSTKPPIATAHEDQGMPPYNIYTIISVLS